MNRGAVATAVVQRTLPVLLAVAPIAASLSAQSSFFDLPRVIDASVSPDAQVAAFTVLPGGSSTPEVYVAPVTGGSAEQLVSSARQPAFAAAGGAFAFIRIDGPSQQLAVRSGLRERDQVVSGDDIQVMSFKWSPDGSQLAFAGWPLGGNRSRPALYVVSASGGAPRRLTPEGFIVGPAEPELPDLIEFDWLDNGRIVVSGRSVGSDESPHAASLHIVDVPSGAMRYLAGTGGRWHLPVVSPNGEWIAFTGQALGPAGWMASELLVLMPDGTGLKRLTVGRDLDALDLAWAGDSRTLWFAAEERGTRNLHKVDTRNGRMTAGTTGLHVLALQAIARRGDFALAIRITPTSAGSLVRFPLGKPHEMVVIAEQPGAEFGGEVEELDLSVEGGRSLHGWLIRPPGFDGSRRYPLLIDIHGGPHAMAGAGYAPFALAHAAAGSLVLRLNPRGSTGLGFDVANGLGARWPGNDVDDLRAAVTALAERGLVDTARIAAVGTGAGAAVAVALRAGDPRVRATILRCADGNWLMGGGIDRPLWSEWYASRPFAATPAAWWQSFARLAGVQVRTPLLVIEGRGSAPRVVTIAEMMHAQTIANGAASTFVRVPEGCDADADLVFARERDFLKI